MTDKRVFDLSKQCWVELDATPTSEEMKKKIAAIRSDIWNLQQHDRWRNEKIRDLKNDMRQKNKEILMHHIVFAIYGVLMFYLFWRM